MAKSSYRIKMSPSMKPFVSRVSRHGAIQRAFRDAGWRQQLSACVKSNVQPKMSGGAIKDAVRACAKQHASNASIPGFPNSGKGGKGGVGN